jgi:hypothetical protein
VVIKRILLWLCTKKYFFQLVNILDLFLSFNFFNQKNGAHNYYISIMFVKLTTETKFRNRINYRIFYTVFKM